MRVNAFAALAPGADLTLYEYEAGELGPLEVDVDVTHCGICHTDLMVIDNDWGAGVPVVAGHEVAGIVSAVGALVDTGRLAVGQRVVVGGPGALGRRPLSGCRRDTVERPRRRRWAPVMALGGRVMVQ
ncbi:alcohol dehydrogenase catalytic domain-containing protein [Mycobacterium sp. smrl_JER01]|uniref:alcohol dehydrogenase catalytic domain-containing protein n=1 Tax=Mycobacterium sp. smrl_JER01 TaxID=3402633 RepID=UPI003AC3ACEA